MKRRLLTIVFALATAMSLLVALTACGGKTPEHVHEFASEWKSDANEHWHVCTGEGCDEVSGKAAHTWNSGVITKEATETADGEKTYTCTVCGKTKTEPVSALGYTIAFDSQGGSAVASIVKDAGETVTAPADPERAGFVFLGWFSDRNQSIFEGATPYVFDKMPDENVTLYAKWAVKLAASYNGYDETVAMTAFNVTEANEDVMFAIDFDKINWDKSSIGVPMYRYEGETRIGLDTEVAKEDSQYVSAVYDDAMQNVYVEGDVLYRYGAGDFYIRHDFSENGRYYVSIKYATPGEYEIGVKVFNWKAAPALELKEDVSKNKTFDGQPVSVTADDYVTNSDGEVTVLWYDWTKNALEAAPVNAGAYYFRLRISETSTAAGYETNFQSKTTDYYRVVISSVEVNVETPHNFTYNGETVYYVDYSSDAVNGERLYAYFSFAADNSGIWLDDWGFEIWGDETEYTPNYRFVYEGDGDMATLGKKVISDLTLRVNYNGTTSFSGITGSKVESSDVIKEYDVNDFEKLTFSVTTSDKTVSATAYSVDFADVVIGGEAAPFYTFAVSGSASVYVDRKELKNLRLTTTESWTGGGSFEITLGENNGIISGETVKVTVSNGNYQDMILAGSTYELVLGSAPQGQEEIALVESGDYGNYVLVANDSGIVGTIMFVDVIENVAFAGSDITDIVSRGGMNVITVELSTSHGIVEGHDVYLEIMTTATTGDLAVTSYNTVVKGNDADKYVLGSGCSVNLGA
ncbi:MAG: InlB B-repeat-containing protein [Christensenellales bacterium]